MRSQVDYVATAPQHWVTTKTIEYGCGCIVTLSAWRDKDASHACTKHGKGVKKITTIEELMDLSCLRRKDEN